MINNQSLNSYAAPIRLGIFTAILLLIWLPLAIPIYLTLGDRNLASILAMAMLLVEFLVWWRIWDLILYQRSNIFKSCGLVNTARNRRDLIKGLAIGLLCCLSLFAIEAILGWVKFMIPSTNLLKIILEGLFSAIGIGLAEELLFRGFILSELERDYDRTTAMWGSSLLYSLLHFIKPLTEVIRTLVTFPALLILGIALVLAKHQHSDRLGICIGLHSGLVWGYYIVAVGNLIEYNDNLPQWLTGIDRNPIAGLMGLLWLIVLVIIFQKFSLKSR
jgi:membrane protease YdiL (CAAX protease family)